MKRCLLILLFFALPASAKNTYELYHPIVHEAADLPILVAPVIFAQTNVFCPLAANCTWTGTNTFTGQLLPGIIDDTLATMKIFNDANNGVEGQAAYILRSEPLIANDPTSVQNFAFYLGGELDCNNTVSEECHYAIIFPKIRRGTGPGINDKLTGLSLAAPIAPAGDTSTAQANIAATVSVESNPPTSWCNSGGTDATALANLGQCSFSLNLSAGPMSTRTVIMFYGPSGGLRNGLGDLGLENRDSTASGTITFYNSGTNLSQMSNAGIWTHKNSAIWNYSSPQIQFTGTEGSARNYAIQESAGSLVFLDNSSPAQRMEINAPGVGAGVGIVNFDVGNSLTERAVTSGAAGVDSCYGDSTAHAIKCNYNNATNFGIEPLVGGGYTFATGNLTTTLNSALTSDAIDAFTFGETSAATGGTLTNGLANQSEVNIKTATNSTAVPLEVEQNSITNTVATPIAQFESTWNNASLTGQGIIENVTNTASASSSLLMNLQVGNATKMSVDKTGYLIDSIESMTTGQQTVTGADYTNSTTTPSTVFTWTLPATAAAKNYKYTCEGLWESTAATLTAPVFGLNLSAAPTQLTGNAWVQYSSIAGAVLATTGYLSNTTTGSQTLITATAAGVTSTNYMWRIWGTIEGAAAAGSTFIINAAALSSVTSTLNIRRGAGCLLTASN